VRITAAQAFAASAFVSGSERERIGEFQARRKKTGGKNFSDRRRRAFHGTETDPQRSAVWRQRQELKRRFCDYAEHSFRANEEAPQVEAGLVLVRAAAKSHDVSIRQHDFEAEHIVARHAVLQTARPARVRGDVSADAAIRAARRVGRGRKVFLLRRHLGVVSSGRWAGR